MKNRFPLNKNWTLKLLSDNGIMVPGNFEMPEKGIPATVPGTVHTDLNAAHLIPDPFYSDNELGLQWISECDWQYETWFDFPADFNAEKEISLVFEGLDTIAEIVLNGKAIGSSKNMFVKYDFILNEALLPKNNHLLIKFRSALKYMQDNKLSIKQFPSARHPDRVFIRKAQYSFGWDWGPAYPTMGIWKTVYLEQAETAKIESVRFNTLAIEKGNAKTEVLIQLKTQSQNEFRVEAELSILGQSFRKQILARGDSEVKINFDIPDAELWWPQGQGSPHLYDLNVKVLDEYKNISAQKELKVGIRTIELQLEDKGKNTFRFLVNSKPVFLKGADWIPVDSFIPRASDNIYQQLIRLAKEANMNVLRVWGGGVYESDLFYDLCDQMGILVWQDFMFACAAYPEHEEFLEDIKIEVEQNILRLQLHPSIAIWCGNNENEWIWYRDTGGTPETMSGHHIFHHFLPEVLKKLDPYSPYWPTTPFGNEADPNDELSGNRHAWEVWSFWLDYKKVVNDRSLFVSEFGFQGPADYHTLRKAIPQKDFHPQSKVFEFHNKQDEGPERLLKFLGQHLPVVMNTRDFIYLTQLNQGFALQSCLEHWRLQWPDAAGSIIWQLNDVWPVTSWSLIDSDLKTKLAYHFTARAFNDRLIVFREASDKIELICLNSATTEFKGRIELKKYSIEDGTLSAFSLDGYEETQIIREEKIVVSSLPGILVKDSVLLATLFDDKDEIVSRNYYLQDEWKHIKFPDFKNDFTLNLVADENSLLISAQKTAFFVTLQHEQLQFSENGFILLPGEQKKLQIKGIIPSDFRTGDIKVFSLNQYLD